MKTKELNHEMMQALIFFASKHGRNWKCRLREAWSNGDYGLIDPNIESALQRVRNTFGPSWLITFSLKKKTSVKQMRLF